MPAQPVIAIFDIGKTNKKLLLFNEQYQVVWEVSSPLEETVDEDGAPCEDVLLLQQWMLQQIQHVFHQHQFNVRAINFAAYGASFVFIDAEGKVLTPLYNYLKPYPSHLHKKFYQQYGGETAVSLSTASPVLGSLNSGLQLYRLKWEQPKIFAQVRHALHLPQYASFVFTGKPRADITSIGCHTQLWDFGKDQYHDWVGAEAWLEKLPPIEPADTIFNYQLIGKEIPVGIGLHDSSAALVPYLQYFSKPFVLLSTGTWCIALNPFNHQPLTVDALKNDCLCYLSFSGDKVKASRLFAGYEHEEQAVRIAAHFDVSPKFYEALHFDANLYQTCIATTQESFTSQTSNKQKCSVFAQRSLEDFISAAAAYHQLIFDLVQQQYAAIQLVLEGEEKHLFVDGGFSKNDIYMQALAAAFPQMEVYAAAMPQATALGAALVLHQHWNPNTLPNNLIQLKKYTPLALPINT